MMMLMLMEMMCVPFLFGSLSINDFFFDLTGKEKKTEKRDFHILNLISLLSNSKFISISITITI